jgi:hypothetical protein
MHLKPTAGCQISTFIFGFGGTPYAYPMKKYRKTAVLCPKWARALPSLIYFSWVIYRVPPTPNPNIKVVYRDSSRHISGGGKGSGPLRMRYWK